jgi:hypothetical protein
MANQIHVVRHPKGGWDVKKDNALRATVHTYRKPEAVARARELAANQGLGLLIHNEDGTVTEKSGNA